MASAPEPAVMTVKLLKPDSAGHMQRIFLAYTQGGPWLEREPFDALVSDLCGVAGGALAEGLFEVRHLALLRVPLLRAPPLGLRLSLFCPFSSTTRTWTQASAQATMLTLRMLRRASRFAPFPHSSRTSLRACIRPLPP